jgi:RND family efflux transporter MFP subunit
MSRNAAIALVVAIGAIATLAFVRLRGGGAAGGGRDRGPAPVEVAPVDRGAIELRRVFTGTLEARERFVVAANVGGRVQRLAVDLSDPVDQGQVVAELDDDDEVQDINESAAELASARASLAEAKSALEIAERELDRLIGLEKRGIVSKAELDAGRSRHLARKTAVDVARARLKRSSATLQRARIRSGYTRVVAAWTGDDTRRVVARRHVHEGDTVAAGDPLLTIVDLEPIDAVVYVTEKEYGQLETGQPAEVTTDAYPGKTFTGTLSRLAPVFNERSRQARLEIELANPDGELKPGMFVRAEVVLDRADDAAIVPVAALTVRDGVTGVFVVSGDGSSVSWQPVTPGIRQGDRVQLVGKPPAGRVVTLGHQLIDDGSAITIPQPQTGDAREES